MEAHHVLFIGGPSDGQLRVLEGPLLDYIEIAEHAPVSVESYRVGLGRNTATFTRHLYKREELFAPHERITFYLHNSLTINTALHQLIKHYAGRYSNCR